MSDTTLVTSPVRLSIAGMTHGHVEGVFRRGVRSDVEIVGIAEADAAVVERYSKLYKLDTQLIYSDLDTMLEVTRPDAVAAFGSIYDHLRVVEACAPRGIPVLVEKPLAVNREHARRIADLAQQHQVHVLTNYETTWYASNHRLHHMIHTDKHIGQIRKLVVHDGHKGPQEIGCPPEFLAWLTDPVQNGGGAVIDFGCYGANLITWLMGNQPPLSVTAVLQQLKPDIYPLVDDEATIVLTYEGAQGIIQASWNWAVGRKDMEVYGQMGYVHAVNSTNIRYRQVTDSAEQTIALERRAAPFDDPFAWLAAVVRGMVKVADDDLSGLTNNLVVIQILDAARESARIGQTIHLTT